MKKFFPLLCAMLLAATTANAQKPIVDKDLVFAEQEGFVTVEAEHFFSADANRETGFLRYK